MNGKEDELLNKYLDEGNTGAAIRLLLQRIEARAKLNDFETAEVLRNKIFEINPFALTEIVRAAEIIEQEKNRAIDKVHLETWARFYENLNPEEINAFYFSLKKVSYGPDHVIYQAGERNRRLYFVESGRLKIIILHDREEVFMEEILVKTLSAGQVAGAENFFNDTVCTSSLITLSQSELYYLDAVSMKSWKDSCPALESKLFEFASKSENVTDFVKAKGFNRRVFKRVELTGKATIQMLSTAGAPVGKPFTGDMCDLSRGGACFYLRITKKETAAMLLGQKVKIDYLHPRLDASRAVSQEGTIVAVRFHVLADCTVHLKFNKLLQAKLIEEFRAL